MSDTVSTSTTEPFGEQLEKQASAAFSSLAQHLEKTDSMKRPGLSPIGDILLRKGYLRKYQLEFLLDLQECYRKANRKMKMGQLLVGHRVVTEEQLEEALNIQDKLPQETVTKMLGQFREQMSHITKLLSGR